MEVSSGIYYVPCYSLGLSPPANKKAACLTNRGMANLPAAHIMPQSHHHSPHYSSRMEEQPISSRANKSANPLSQSTMSTPFPRQRDNPLSLTWECCFCAKEGVKTNYPHTTRQCNKHKPPHKSRRCCRGHQVRRRNYLGVQEGGSEHTFPRGLTTAAPTQGAEDETASQLPLLKPRAPQDFEKEGRRHSLLGSKPAEGASGSDRE